MDFAVNIIGCAFNTYWIVQHGDDLYLIDQHAAHERRLYEEFNHREVAAASQELLVPQLITLQPREFELVEAWQEELEELGYRFERVGALSLNLIAVPVLNGTVFDGESLHQALNAIGADRLNSYFAQDDCFEYWAGSVRVYEGRHHYWTDEELGIDP